MAISTVPSRSCLKIRSSRFGAVRKVQISKRWDFGIALEEKKRGIFFEWDRRAENEPGYDRVFIRKLPRATFIAKQFSSWKKPKVEMDRQRLNGLYTMSRSYSDILPTIYRCLRRRNGYCGWMGDRCKQERREYPSSSCFSTTLFELSSS